MKNPHPTPIVRIEPRQDANGLPVEARRQLWQHIWNRLLAPPIEPVSALEPACDTETQVADDAA